MDPYANLIVAVIFTQQNLPFFMFLKREVRRSASRKQNFNDRNWCPNVISINASVKYISTIHYNFQYFFLNITGFKSKGGFWQSYIIYSETFHAN